MGEPSPRAESTGLSPEHLARRLKARSAQIPERRPRPPVWKEVALLVVVAAALIAAWPFSEVDTLDYPEARANADRLRAVMEPVWSGDVSIEDVEVPPGLEMYAFGFQGSTAWVLTHEEPTTAGTCYGLRTGGGLVTAAVRFAPTDGCIPPDRVSFEASGAWDDVLPRQRVTPVWFVPIVGILIGVALGAGASIAMKRLHR